MIVAPTTIEASLVARRLMRWGARPRVAPTGGAGAAAGAGLGRDPGRPRDRAAALDARWSNAPAAGASS